MSLLSPPLQAFIAIAKHGTVHNAAHAIHITQTAVTQRIRSLEEKLNTSLFIRTRRGMELTTEGKALLRYCQATQDLEGEALAKIKGVGIDSDIKLSITGPSSIMHSRVIPQCLPVIKKFPRLLLEFDMNDVENRHKGLRSGQHQLAVIQPEDVEREMCSKALRTERYVLVCSAQWKNRKLKDIIKNERIVDFNPGDQITLNYLKQYHLFNDARHDRHFVNRTESLTLLLIAELGYSVLTQEFCKPFVESKQLIILNQHKTYENELLLAWFPRTHNQKCFSALINAIN